ncbi:unnamed protein product [Sphagnum tenellum]
MVPLAVLFLFWTRYKCWRCAVLLLAKMQKNRSTLGDAERFQLTTLVSCVDLLNQNSVNSEECSKTFPSLVKTETAMSGAVMLGSKPWISSKESNEDNGKGVMDSSKYLTGFKETDMNGLRGKWATGWSLLHPSMQRAVVLRLTLQDIPLMSRCICEDLC